MSDSILEDYKIPGWLYAIWPYLVLIITVAFVYIGYYPISIITGGYAVWLFVVRWNKSLY